MEVLPGPGLLNATNYQELLQLALLQEHLLAWTKGVSEDYDAYLKKCIHPDLEYHVRSIPDEGPQDINASFYGHDGFRAYFQKRFSVRGTSTMTIKNSNFAARGPYVMFLSLNTDFPTAFTHIIIGLQDSLIRYVLWRSSNCTVYANACPEGSLPKAQAFTEQHPIPAEFLDTHWIRPFLGLPLSAESDCEWEGKPCPHNSWDFLRTKKKKRSYLRCRICDVRWNMPCPELTARQCKAFRQNGCTSPCPFLHVHLKKQHVEARAEGPKDTVEDL